jgi:hypothetical protein
MHRRAMLEAMVFLGSTVLGIYAMGQLWHAAFHLGGSGSLLWTAILFLCLFLLGKQIGRVQAHQASTRKEEPK